MHFQLLICLMLFIQSDLQLRQEGGYRLAQGPNGRLAMLGFERMTSTDLTCFKMDVYIDSRTTLSFSVV